MIIIHAGDCSLWAGWPLSHARERRRQGGVWGRGAKKVHFLVSRLRRSISRSRLRRARLCSILPCCTPTWACSQAKETGNNTTFYSVKSVEDNFPAHSFARHSAPKKRGSSRPNLIFFLFKLLNFLFRILDGCRKMRGQPVHQKCIRFEETAEEVYFQLVGHYLLKAAKYEIQKPSTCHVTLFRCTFWSMFPVFHLARSTWRNAARWLVDLLGHEQICCTTSFEFDEKRATKPKFVAQRRPGLYFSQQLSSTRSKCFCCGSI